MNIQLYQSLDNHNTINKRKVLIDSYPISLKKQTNILNPTITLYLESELPKVDYAFIDVLERYYHVINIEPKPNKIYILYLEVDVLETYKEDILKAKKIKFLNNVKPDISILKSNVEPSEDVSYILSVVARESVTNGGEN